MRRYFFSIMVLLCSVVFVNAQDNLPKRGYVGQGSLSLGAIGSSKGVLPIGNISTTHGYQFNDRFFLGGGVSSINTQFLAVYATVSGNLRKPTAQRTSYPYLTLNLGYNFSTWAGERFGDQQGVMIEPQLGWSFYSEAGKLRYNTFISAIVFNFNIIPQIGLAIQF